MDYQGLALAALAASVVSGQTMNLTATLESNSNLSTLATLVGAYPNLLASLSNATNITLLAPSNAALNLLLGTNLTSAATTIPGYVETLLSYHVLNGTYPAANITNLFPHTGLTNTSYANVTGGQVVEAVGGSSVTFYSGLKNNVTVSQSNINFTGGLIHIIEGVLTIPLNVTATAQAANLTALVGAATALNLTNTLDDLSDVTIFAPTNAAFGSIGSVLANASTAELTSVLSYHVINGSVLYSPYITNTTLKTLGGGNVTITVHNGTVFVNSARVINPDVLVANGVVHVIDAVLNPNNTQATANATESTATPAFSGASSSSNIPFTSGVVAPTTSVAAAGTATSHASAGSAASSASAAASSSHKGAAGPAFAVQTGAVGAAALFGGAAVLANW